MRKYAQYQKEKYNRKVVENEYGFICYNVYADGSLYIQTLYVIPEARAEGKGKSLEQYVIEKEGPKVVFCKVDRRSNDWEDVLRIIMGSGYSVYSESDTEFMLWKECNE